MKSAICLLVVMLAGCAAPQPPRPWKKEGGNLAQDRSVCEYEAAKAVVGMQTDSRSLLGQSIEEEIKKGEIYDLCLKSKGWTR